MRKNLLLFIFIFTATCLCKAQSRWGFGVTVNGHKSSDGVWVKYCFIGDVVDLTALNCADINPLKDSGSKKKEAKFYKECLEKIFFLKIKGLQYDAAKDILEMDILCVVKKLAINIDDCTDDEVSCLYLQRGEVEKIRANYIENGKRGGERVVEVH